MHRISRYIGRTVGWAILVVLLLIVGLDAVAAIIDQTGDMRADYGFAQSLVYVLLTLPGRIYEYIPLAALVGSLVAMGSLASSSELIVCRVAGVSLSRLIWFACKPVIWLILASLLITEYVSPLTDQWAQSYKDLARWGKERSIAADGGLWHREGDSFMHFNAVQPGGVLYGVTVFEFDDRAELSRATFAARASYQRERWLLESVRSTEFGAGSIGSDYSNTRSWDTQLTPELLGYISLAAEDLSVSGLNRYAAYLEAQALDSGEYRLAFWQKVFQPLAVVSLVLIAMSFVFGPLRESTAGYRLFIGVIVGIAFQFVQNLLGPSSLIYGFSPVLAVLLPIVACLLLGAMLLSRVR